MSQNPFGQPTPFGAPGPGGPSEPAPLPVEPEQPTNKRNKVLYGAIAGLAALSLAGTGLFILVVGGGEDDDLGGPITPPAAAPAPAETEAPTPLPTSVEFAGRNPFKAKIIEGSGGAGGAAEPTTSPTTGTGSDDGGTPPAGSGGGGRTPVVVPGGSGGGLPGRDGSDGVDGAAGEKGEKGDPGQTYVLPVIKFIQQNEDGTGEFELWLGGPIDEGGLVSATGAKGETLGDDAPLSWIQVLWVSEDYASVKLGDARPVTVAKDKVTQLF
jgi:hypothetical protein